MCRSRPLSPSTSPSASARPCGPARGCTAVPLRHKLEHSFNLRGGDVLTWLFLGIAVLTEVAATVALKLSDGFTRVVPAGVVVLGYGASFVLMSKILQRGMHL